MKYVKRGSILFLVILCCAAIGYIGWNRYERDASADRAARDAGSRMQLSLFISGPSSSRLPDPGNDFVRKAIESKFDVSLKVSFMEPGEAYEAKIADLLAANDPPDMWLQLSPDGGAKQALDNVLADMTYFVTPKTMPNYFTYWMNEKELKEYQLHNKFVRAPIPYDKKSYRAYYIRKDWLQRLGLAVPRTYDEYVAVLKAFTFGDPDGNGKNDTYGFTVSGNGSSLSLDWPEFVKNGLLYPAYFENDRLIDMQSDPLIQQTVTDILNVSRGGLVDPDWFLNKGQQHIDKAVQGKAGIVLGHSADFALDANPESIQTRGRQVNPQADWVPFNPFGGLPLCAAPTPDYPFVYSNNAAGLNQEKLKRMTEILDWLAGAEGFLLTHYGLEHEHYTRKGNTITLYPDKIEADIVKKGDFLKIWDFFTPNTPDVLGLKVIDPRRTVRDQVVLDTVTSIPVLEGLGTTLTPPLGINVEAMRAKQNELLVKMMFSDKSSARWPEYRRLLMEQYNGDAIFKQYEEKIRAARGGR
ncbi:extracellular solute-binding protein [Paenibacillus mesophilus]|uniref:extracellular solute-binding protein n=1 Tax=Paenibacillus mesophilus TaxID=2582849 RepID=UPI00110D4477|nr:extracellular solute-binding protein [Paenibacillus mesophilus]TMV45780.1 extracellular solute-binding protein [Paenibacillus mesophilus]